MMKQYFAIKKKYADCLLFYRMGDFYELFMEDAFIGAQILNITLTHKRGGKDGNIPMAGIPYHAVDGYLHKLVTAGYKVAICEQLSPPSKRGLVLRDVIRIVTPGTVLDEKALEKKTNNFIISIDIQEDVVAIGVADLSTGYFATMQQETSHPFIYIKDELSRLNPSECILPEALYNNPEILKTIKSEEVNINCFKNWEKYSGNAESFLTDHFHVKTLSIFGLEGKLLALQTAAALLGYLQTTQKTPVSHIRKITVFEQSMGMLLDKSTMINLELFSTIREHNTHGSLISVLDETITAMGGRMLKLWLKNPLLKKDEIIKRQDGVEELFSNNSEREHLREKLREVNDVERVLSRLSVNIGNARDLVNLQVSLQQIIGIKKHISQYRADIFGDCGKHISPNIEKVIKIIEKNIVDEPPLDTKIGGMIREGVDKELDQLRGIIKNSKDFITQLEKIEREKTRINSLKIKFNQVFGFYIEISKANIHLVPKEYLRKQTLVNGERFITPALKKHEDIILNAQEKANDLEYKLFALILSKVLMNTESIQNAATAIAIIDCIGTFAHISRKYNYVRPTLVYSGEIRITEGRHPVVEKLLGNEIQFVPNDVCLDNLHQSLLLITGPNMAGKSVFIRQVALIVLMNQLGCFVPAKHANLSIVDRIFVRSGASDVIASGLSTFMVEMVETAHILHNATSKSLIIMDEIGRGTSTYDGISIAWAVATYLVQNFTPAPKTLFATHYHELQALENEYPSIKNFHMAVSSDKGDPVFLHTLLPDGASHSFGVAVAKLAGVPQEVIAQASNMLHSLETRSTSAHAPKQNETIEPTKIQSSLTSHFIQKELENLDIANMTPLEALNKLAKLKDQVTLFESESKQSLLEAD